MSRWRKPAVQAQTGRRDRRDDRVCLVEFLRAVSHFLQLLAAEAKAPVRLPPGRLLSGWAKGFSRLAALLYDLEHRDPLLYLTSYRQQVASLKINGAMDHVINDKLLLPVLMKSAGVPAAKLLAFRRRGLWQAACGRAIDDLARWLIETLPAGGKAVVKPVRGHKGRGVFFIERTAAGVTVNGEPCAAKELPAHFPLRRDLVLTEFVEQAAYARTLYAPTSNSIRVLTAWDILRGEPFVVAAAQRIGTRRSFPVDNWLEGLGGLCAEVDMNTGKLSAAATIENRRRVAWHDRHPESGAPIAGVAVPGWTTIRRALRRGAARLPFAPLLGWDILVTEKGFCVLELNGPPGLAVHQVHRPLLDDERLRRFYSAYGILSVGDAKNGAGGETRRRHEPPVA
jgi:hypothetical protein